MKQLNSHNFEEVYKKLGINLDTLGCIMLDLQHLDKDFFPAKKHLYYTKDKAKFWINGFVASKHAHITLLYGLLESGKKWRSLVKKVLSGWEVKSVKVKEIGFFDSPYKDEPYYCIVAHIDLTPELLEGHQRLEFLPHINTFAGYKAHFTLAYVEKDEAIREIIIDFFNKNLVGKELKIQGINFGK